MTPGRSITLREFPTGDSSYPAEAPKGSPDFREPQLSRNLRFVRLLRAIGNHHGRTPAKAAIAWVLHNPAVTGAIVGARRPGQVRGVVGAAVFRLSPQELAEIDAFFRKVAA